VPDDLPGYLPGWVQIEEARRREQADKIAAINALERQSKEIMRHKQVLCFLRSLTLGPDPGLPGHCHLLAPLASRSETLISCPVPCCQQARRDANT
jgi:hypothetical protein